jgi:3-hydroxybutyrate dehydrogenase
MDHTLTSDLARPVEADLSGRSALVTGGASGIGLACARRLASAGASVTIADVDAPGAHAAAEDMGATPLVLDLNDTRALAVLELDVDIIVNNAGFQHVARIEEFDPAIFSSMLKVMLEAPFLLVRAALPKMYERGYGRIVNISSIHGLRASEYKAAYVSAKHGLEGLSKVIALEGGAHGVTSNTICPSYVRTPLVEGQIADQARLHGISEDDVLTEVMLKAPAIKRLLEPEEVAELVVYLCTPAASFITGASIAIDGGWTAG